MIAKVMGVNIEYSITGFGKPVVILSNSEETQIEKVFAGDKEYKRIYVRIPGVGNSEVADWMISSDDVLNVLLDFVDQLLGHEKFLLIGFSYPSYLTQGIVALKPEQVDGIAMFYPVVYAASEQRDIPTERIVFKDNNFLSQLSDSELEDVSSYIIQDRRVWELVQELKSFNTGVLNVEFYNRLKQTGCYGFSFPIVPLSTPFKKPALIVMGRQDYVVGYKDSLQLIDSYPRATFSIIDMAGHRIAFEQNEMFVLLLSDWLKRCSHDENRVYNIYSLV